MVGCGFTKRTVPIFLLIILLLSGCKIDANTVKRNTVPSKAAVSQDTVLQTTATNSADSKLPRAVGKSINGEILVIPTETESIEQLGAPSSLGAETDYSFKSTYKIAFKDLNGNIMDIASYSGQIIGKDKSPIRLWKIDFKDIEIFYFKPIPNTSRPEALYLFGVDKNRKAFQLSFEYPDKIMGNTTSSPDSILGIEDNWLVIPTWEPEEGNYKQFFELDIQKER
jgi:hypothetical protein